MAELSRRNLCFSGPAKRCVRLCIVLHKYPLDKFLIYWGSNTIADKQGLVSFGSLAHGTVLGEGLCYRLSFDVNIFHSVR